MKEYPKCYKYIIRELHESFLKSPRYNTMTFPIFVDRIVEQFIPKEYFDILSVEQKDELLSTIVCDFFSTFAASITKPECMVRIIDNRDKNREYMIRYLITEGFNILNVIKETMYNKLLSEIGQAKSYITPDVADNMRRDLQRLMEENVRLEKEVIQLNKKIKVLEDREGKYIELIGILKASLKKNSIAKKEAEDRLNILVMNKKKEEEEDQGRRIRQAPESRRLTRREIEEDRYQPVRREVEEERYQPVRREVEERRQPVRRQATVEQMRGEDETSYTRRRGRRRVEEEEELAPKVEEQIISLPDTVENMENGVLSMIEEVVEEEEEESEKKKEDESRVEDLYLSD